MRAPKQSANEKEIYSSALSFEFHNSETLLVAFSTCTLCLSSSRSHIRTFAFKPGVCFHCTWLTLILNNFFSSLVSLGKVFFWINYPLLTALIRRHTHISYQINTCKVFLMYFTMDNDVLITDNCSFNLYWQFPKPCFPLILYNTNLFLQLTF